MTKISHSIAVDQIEPFDSGARRSRAQLARATAHINQNRTNVSDLDDSSFDPLEKLPSYGYKY